MNPLEKKNEITINHRTSLVKAEKAAENVRVLVMTVRARHVTDHAPTGKGATIRPVMVVRNMERSCHAFVESWWGFGTAKLKIMPMVMEIRRGVNLAPFH